MHWIKTILFIVASLLLFTAGRDICRAQTEEKVIFFPGGKTFDFGDITLADGPQKCSFSFKNVSSEPIRIFNIISSCGCTQAVWTREDVQPGKTGTISVDYSNDQGAFPFDKTLTVYVSGLNRPVLLHIRGVVHEKSKPLGERFPVHVGDAGFRELSVSLKYIEQGRAKSDRTTIANLSDRPLRIESAEASEGLFISVSPNPVAPGSTAVLSFSVDTRKMKNPKWGRETFSSKFRINGKLHPALFKVDALIKEDFSSLNESEISSAAIPSVEKTYYEFGAISAGSRVTASFTIRNSGKKNLTIHKIDSDNRFTRPLTVCPFTIKPGASATVRASVDTRNGEKGEHLSVLSLITNSPKRPIVNLFITGIIN